MQTQILSHIENVVRHCSTCLDHQNMQLQEETAPFKVPAKLLEEVDTNICMINNEVCFVL